MNQTTLLNCAVPLAIAAVAIFARGAAIAAEPGEAADQRMLTVSGEGEVKAVPDEARLSAGVLTQAHRAAEALAANSQAMNQVFAALKHLGIPDQSIQTSDFSVQPVYQTDRNGNTNQKISGYEVSNDVRVTVDDLARLGPALDALVASGSNSLGSIAFAIHDPKPLMTEARSEAMKDAISRAQTYAAAGGFTLGPVLAVTEGGGEMPPPVFRPMRMAAAPAAPPPVASGVESVNATVSVTFEIR
jgi:uncharacterized protein YggE